MLSTRPDIVPPSMTAELRRLHDEVSPAPFAIFEPVLRAELGAGWRRRFRSIDTDTPWARRPWPRHTGRDCLTAPTP